MYIYGQIFGQNKYNTSTEFVLKLICFIVKIDAVALNKEVVFVNCGRSITRFKAYLRIRSLQQQIIQHICLQAQLYVSLQNVINRFEYAGEGVKRLCYYFPIDLCGFQFSQLPSSISGCGKYEAEWAILEQLFGIIAL